MEGSDGRTIPVSVMPIRIEEDKRYTLIISTPYALLARDMVIIREQAQTMLSEWWNSGEKFLVVVLDKGLEARLERVGES